MASILLHCLKVSALRVGYRLNLCGLNALVGEYGDCAGDEDVGEHQAEQDGDNARKYAG